MAPLGAQLLAACLVFVLLSPGSQAAQQGASITVKARWNSTSYLLEAAEFLVCLGSYTV